MLNHTLRTFLASTRQIMTNNNNKQRTTNKPQILASTRLPCSPFDALPQPRSLDDLATEDLLFVASRDWDVQTLLPRRTGCLDCMSLAHCLWYYLAMMIDMLIRFMSAHTRFCAHSCQHRQWHSRTALTRSLSVHAASLFRIAGPACQLSFLRCSIP